MKFSKLVIGKNVYLSPLRIHYAFDICSISIVLLASPAGRNPSGLLVQISRECTPLYLSTGISNLLQPAQAEVVLGSKTLYR